MSNWFIVHDLEAFEDASRQRLDGSNTIGFNNYTYNAKNIEPRDMIVYYFKNPHIAIKGIYQVKPRPWQGVVGWSSDYQIDIAPIIELEEPCDLKELISSLELFKGSERWYAKIQGTNGIRELSETDFITFRNHVIKKSLESNME